MKNNNSIGSAVMPLSNARYGGLQILRFFAAALVVVTHSTFVMSERTYGVGGSTWQKGAVGVDIFFVLSGLVMMLSAESLRSQARGWYVFAEKRLIRIVPMYWLATTTKLFIVLLVPSQAAHTGLNWLHVLCSYFFIPFRNPFGEVVPLHAVGWTLTYEMFFYGVFCFSLFMRWPPLRFVSILFCVLIATGLIWEGNSSIFIFTKPIVLLFVAGMAIGRILQRGVRLPCWAALALILCGTGIIASFDVLDGWAAFLLHGVPSAMIVAGVAFLEPWISTRKLPFLRELGDASYSLYIFHPFVIGVLAVLLLKIGLLDFSQIVVLVAVTSIAVSVLIYRKLEWPLMKTLQNKIAPA